MQPILASTGTEIVAPSMRAVVQYRSGSADSLSADENGHRELTEQVGHERGGWVVNADSSPTRMRKTLPWLWLAMSLAWAVVIFVTDQPAWPLALWIATTVGPLTYFQTSRTRSESDDSNTKGTQE